MLKMGDEVLVVSNNDEPVWSGILQKERTLGTSVVPQVKRQEDGREFVVMGFVLPYNATMLSTLNSMNYKERWQWLCDFIVYRNTTDAKTEENQRRQIQRVTEDHSQNSCNFLY